MDVERLKEDVRRGRITVDRLIEVVVTSWRELQVAKEELHEAKQQLDEAKRRIAELEGQRNGSATAKVTEPFSVRAEEQRQEARGKKRCTRKRRSRGGRTTTAEKIAQATRTEKVFPTGVPEEACWLSHTRPVWRLENCQAVLVAYEIYRGPRKQYGKIPGVFGRSEFGAEILVAIAYQVYVVGLSFDKVCLLLNFFQNLKLRKSQADALLNQLARQWEGEFDLLMLAKQLFTFVTAEPVEKPNGETLAVPGTNNESERTLRSAAMARNTGRTNKTVRGARRRTVIVSVLESLRQHLSRFTLSSVIAEIRHWFEAGESCFARLAEKLRLTGPASPTDDRQDAGRPSLLDRLLPLPDG